MRRIEDMSQKQQAPRREYLVRRDRLGWTPLIVVLTLAVALLAGQAQGQTAGAPAAATAPAAVKKAARPNAAVDPKSCVTAECHVEVKNFKFVHGPVNVNACDACHKTADVTKHTYTLSREKTQLCGFCHKVETGDNKVVHKPMQTGECLGCHNPHGGKTAKLVRGNTIKDACNTCHQDVAKDKKAVHGPVAAGACDACHTPHAGKFTKLLTSEPKTICMTCHKEMGDQLKLAKVTHKPVMTGECSQCHDPHASNFTMQTKAAPADLCTSCHEHQNIKKTATESKHKHSVVMKDQACSSCHTAHGSQLAKLMRAQPVDVCMKCHGEKQKTPDGREIPAVADVKNPKFVKHGPVKEGNCGGCHNVHGSDVTRLLTKPYPETFYAKFDDKNFALCFSCHDKKLVEAKEAEGLTGFRDGARNLHFLHVNKDRGRTCRACHETHASAAPLHIRAAVPYGQWSLPINFKKTDNGGSCSPGCHKEFTYDRKAPAGTQQAEASATQPAEKDGSK